MSLKRRKITEYTNSFFLLLSRLKMKQPIKVANLSSGNDTGYMLQAVYLNVVLVNCEQR